MIYDDVQARLAEIELYDVVDQVRQYPSALRLTVLAPDDWGWTEAALRDADCRHVAVSVPAWVDMPVPVVEAIQAAGHQIPDAERIVVVVSDAGLLAHLTPADSAWSVLVPAHAAADLVKDAIEVGEVLSSSWC